MLKNLLHDTIQMELEVIFEERGWKMELIEDSIDNVLDYIEDYKHTRSLGQIITMWEKDTANNYDYEYRTGNF